jgi:hypothetical protein
MVLQQENSYAFDDCSILHLCHIAIPKTFKIWFESDKICPRNYKTLKQFIDKLKDLGISKYRFVPSNFEANALRMIDDILMNYNVKLLGDNFKVQVYDQLQEFYETIQGEFIEINKDKNTSQIKDVFIKNELKLSKDGNIPKDDDLSILSGYVLFATKGKKYLISEDEHFWGYGDIILENFNIIITREHTCLTLI